MSKETESPGWIKPIGKVNPKAWIMKRDIAFYNSLNDLEVHRFLDEICKYSGRKFGSIIVKEAMWSHKEGETTGDLIGKCQCTCGNIVVTPMRLLLSGRLTNCGCKTPLPAEVKKEVRVYESESYTKWATTVEGIMWYGNRLMWAVARNFDGYWAPMYMTESVQEALQMRMDLEKKYWGESLIEQYYEPMLKELQQIEKVYLKKHPPKIEGVTRMRDRWQVRLWVRGELVMSEYRKTREEALQLRYDAEVKYYGESFLPRKYYV